MQRASKSRTDQIRHLSRGDPVSKTTESWVFIQDLTSFSQFGEGAATLYVSPGDSVSKVLCSKHVGDFTVRQRPCHHPCLWLMGWACIVTCASSAKQQASPSQKHCSALLSAAVGDIPWRSLWLGRPCVWNHGAFSTVHCAGWASLKPCQLSVF